MRRTGGSRSCGRGRVTRAAIVSFRLGGPDGVSVEAAKWARALANLGVDVTTVAGEGSADVLLPGLAADAGTPPSRAEVEAAFEGADLVVAENLLSLPLNPEASAVVAATLRGRPAVLHHHDLPWQRPWFADHPPPPDDRRWVHVTINELSRGQLAERGISATTVYNTFDTSAPPGDRASARSQLGISESERLLLHPTRAIPRKNVPAALALAEAVHGTYWLLGPAEDGYRPELDALLSTTPVRVIEGDHGLTVADAYAACDAVLYPSTWEGFGNPALESAVHRRALAVGAYPVAVELASFGFEWMPSNEPAPLATWFEAPDPRVLEHNWRVARRYFDASQLPSRLERLLGDAGVAPHQMPR